MVENKNGIAVGKAALQPQTIDVKNKLAGLLVPVFALKEKDSLGVGDTVSVMRAIDFTAANGMTVLQLLPINETGADNSPYGAISSVALDPMYLAMVPDMVPGLTETMVTEALAALTLVERERLDSNVVDYPLVKGLKKRLLRAAYDIFKKKEDPAFLRFKQECASWLDDYVHFRAMVEQLGTTVWTHWPEEYATIESVRVKCRHSEELTELCDFFAYVQFVAFAQWKQVRAYGDKLGIELMGDIPFGVSRYSADVFAKRELFNMELSGGAPPEKYFQGDKFTAIWGQNWGIPLYDWKHHEATGYKWWRDRVQYVADIFHYFRIDHVLGFFRVYAFPWIPERNWEFVDLSEGEVKEMLGRLPGFEPRPDEPEENAQLNCEEGTVLLSMILSAAREKNCKVVAEDLGMVPDYVRPRLKELGIPGFTIPIFERVEEDRSFKPKETHEQLSLVTYGTHDHEPIASYYEGLSKWWHGEDGHEGWLEVQRLLTFLGLPTDNPPEHFDKNLHRAFIEVSMDCPSWLAMFMVSDLFGSSQRFNEPGIAGDSNWSQRLPLPLADYGKQSDIAECLGWLKLALEKSGRRHKHSQ